MKFIWMFEVLCVSSFSSTDYLLNVFMWRLATGWGTGTLWTYCIFKRSLGNWPIFHWKKNSLTICFCRGSVSSTISQPPWSYYLCALWPKKCKHKHNLKYFSHVCFVVYTARCSFGGLLTFIGFKSRILLLKYRNQANFYLWSSRKSSKIVHFIDFIIACVYKSSKHQ